MKIANELYYIGVNDHEIDLFEGQYEVPNGMAYNSYVIIDEKVAVFDTVDARFFHQWIDNLQKTLYGKKVDYLIISHMEPDHSANIFNFMKTFTDAKIVSSKKAFDVMLQFFGTDFDDRKIIIKEGDELNLGTHNLKFISAPMVHWPEVMVTYDQTSKILFSADGFGKFGALDVEEDWACEARRYYFGIVGKYGAQVQSLLKKLSGTDVNAICPLHGPILTENLGYYLDLYNTWSSYTPEKEGIMIAYTSVYGNTKKAVNKLADLLRAKGCPNVVVSDLARSDMAENVEDAFKYNKLILATTTYNAEIFPFMREFINELVERNYQNRIVGFIENGSWAPLANKVMKEMLGNQKNLTFLENNVTIKSALNEDSSKQIELMANELCSEYIEKNGDLADKNNLSALFNIGYGLYVVTSNDGQKDNGLIVNSVTQVTSQPNRIAVTINKQNYSHHVIKQTGILNLNCISVDAPFKLFETFGFNSGRNVNKFEKVNFYRSDNGLACLSQHVNSFMSLKVESYLDLDTHGMFICTVTEARVVSDFDTMTYNYYFENVKPKPNKKAKGYACKICGYYYEGAVLPEDFICPLCKHPASDFEKID